MANDYESFYAAAYRRVLRQLVLVTGELAEAEDVVQEAFARAAVRWDQLRTYDAPEAWVRRVALNLAAQSARRLRRQARALLRLGPPVPVPEVEAGELDLARALGALSLRQRQVVVLHHLAGLPVQEVARELGVPTGTVKSRLTRARSLLARRLAVAGEEMVARE
ncbi:MAG TPA: SigE family RNA polymerase sigma factor [Actinomycetes bacterium]|nr:SigE family RNA polymerase sigma factor [Actinomycetes bacterium]